MIDTQMCSCYVFDAFHLIIFNDIMFDFDIYIQ